MQGFIHFDLEQQDYFKYAALTAAAIFIILFTAILYRSQSANARASRRAGECTELYESVQVQSGESLWEISSRYYSDEYKSMKRYIAKIKRLNHLSGEKISAGTYLIIPYYAAAVGENTRRSTK